MLQGQERACMPVYIGKIGDLVGCYRCLTHTHTQTDNRIYSATQLVYSIKFKLSHAIKALKLFELLGRLTSENAGSVPLS